MAIPRLIYCFFFIYLIFLGARTPNNYLLLSNSQIGHTGVRSHVDSRPKRVCVIYLTCSVRSTHQHASQHKLSCRCCCCQPTKASILKEKYYFTIRLLPDRAQLSPPPPSPVPAPCIEFGIIHQLYTPGE